MKRLKLLISFLLPISLFLAGCGGTQGKESKEKVLDNQLMVYTTVYPLQYFTEAIGGNAVHVETVYPPGSDEHTFDPSQKDMMKLADSDLFIYVGLGLEGFVEKAKGSLESEKVTFHEAGKDIHIEGNETSHTEEHAAEDDHNHGDIDPHVWLDPIYSKELAASIKEALINQIPENEEIFNQNYDALVQKLDTLNNDFSEVISQAEQPEIIVSHAAFGYWESRYGLKQISISGLSTSNEPSQKELESIVLTAKEHNTKYIFFEQNVSSKLTEIVQGEIGAEPLYLHNLAVLTSEDIDNGRDYFSIMNDNLQSLKKALY
jgi:zinc transport system substrate-binding protein